MTRNSPPHCRCTPNPVPWASPPHLGHSRMRSAALLRHCTGRARTRADPTLIVMRAMPVHAKKAEDFAALPQLKKADIAMSRSAESSPQSPMFRRC